MEEGMGWLIFLQSLQMEFDFYALIVSQRDDEWKGRMMGWG